jgi:hypothetical protein
MMHDDGRSTMNDSSAFAHDGVALRRAMARDGYIFLPELLPREAVLAGMRRIVAEVGSAIRVATASSGDDQLAASGAVEEANVRIADRHLTGDYGIICGAKVDTLLSDMVIRQVLGAPGLVALVERLFGEPAVSYDYKWLRLVAPGAATGFHMDSAFFGRSQVGGSLDSRLYTAWLPWHDLVRWELR